MLKLDKRNLTVLALIWCVSLAGAYWLGSRGPGSRTSALPDAATAASARTSGGSAFSPAENGPGSARGASSSPDATRRDSRRDTGAAFLRLARDGAVEDLGDQLENLTATMSLDDVHDALAGLDEIEPSPYRQLALYALLDRWGKLNPAEAAEYAGNIAAPQERFEAMTTVFSSWGESNPRAALQHVLDHPGESSREQLDAVFRGLAKSTDIAGSLQFMESLNEEDTPYGSRMYESIRRMFERSDKEVIAWTEKLPKGEVRERAITAVIDQWARYDPIAAKAWLEKNGSGKVLPEAQIELGESWARVNPDEAFQWASSLPSDSKTAAAVMDRVFDRWMQYDFDIAAQHLAEVDPSPQLDRTFERYIARVRSVNPADTMPWAESITDPERRRRAIYSVASEWKKRDKSGFENYIRSTGSLSDKEKIKLLR